MFVVLRRWGWVHTLLWLWTSSCFTMQPNQDRNSHKLARNRLGLYITNIALLDWWLTTIVNNRTWWSMNLKTSQKHRSWWFYNKIAALTMVNLNKWKAMENLENTLINQDIPWKCIGKPCKPIKNWDKKHDIQKHCQRWLSPNNRISSNGKLVTCAQKTSVSHCFHKKTIAIASP